READRAIIVFAGQRWPAHRQIWLLPGDFQGRSPLDAVFAGMPLDLLLSLSAALPGRSAVVLAGGPPAEVAVQTPPPIVNVPQGVLLLAGPREAALQA